MIGLFLASGGMAALLKLVFRVPREVGIDPLSFPSIHTAAASSLIFSYPHPLSILYAVIVGLLRIVEGYHTFVDVIGGILTAFLTHIIFYFIEDKDRERKMVHFGVSMLSGFFMLFVNQIAIAIIILAGISVARMISFLWNAFARNERDRAPLYLSIGLLSGALVGIGPLVGILMATVDTLSYVVGKIFRTEKKSVYGLIGGFVGGVLFVFLLRGFYEWPLLLSIGIVAPFVEYKSRVDDNATLPLFTLIVALVLGQPL